MFRVRLEWDVLVRMAQMRTSMKCNNSGAAWNVSGALQRNCAGIPTGDDLTDLSRYRERTVRGSFKALDVRGTIHRSMKPL